VDVVALYLVGRRGRADQKIAHASFLFGRNQDMPFSA